LSEARVKEFRVQLEGLKEEGLQYFESVFLREFPEYSQDKDSRIRRTLLDSSLENLLSLAQFAYSFVAGPDTYMTERKKCYDMLGPTTIPEVREAIENKDGEYLKKRFPLGLDIVIECCSWLYESPPN
jgi:hypothetical protein